MGMGEKNPEIYTKTKEKSPVWLPSPSPPSIKIGVPDSFPPARRNRKQAGPTLGGAGILIYRGQRNKGLGVVWVDTTR